MYKVSINKRMIIHVAPKCNLNKENEMLIPKLRESMTNKIKQIKHKHMKKSTFLLVLILAVATTANAQFKLPELAFPYEAYEEAIDAQTMEIHHSRHHAGYTNNFNNAIEQNGLEGTSLEDILANISKFPKSVRDNGGGYYNHTLFWEILSPEPSEPSDELNQMITKFFGSKEDLIDRMSKQTASQFGSGWGWLILTPRGELKIVTTANQDNPLMDVVPEEDRGTPLLGIDVWEHAYYLRYQNARTKYLSNIWNIINWDQVSKNYATAYENLRKRK